VSAVVVFKDDTGKLAGFGDKGRRAFEKFQRKVRELEPGETLHFEWREPRSPQHHRYFFAKLGELFDRQEQFDDVDKLRAWLTVGAGECDFVPGPKGRMVAMPKSIAWHKLDEVEFTELRRRVEAFMWSDHARRFLWPHLSDEETYQMVAQWLEVSA
jgi:hypothetical protein